MSSINNIVNKLRESRINEAAQEYEYKFDIPWREAVEFEDDTRYHYNTSAMEYAAEIMHAAREDFNDVEWSKYTSTDSRTEDCGILSMTMDFDNKANCIVTVTTSKTLGDDQISKVIRYLEGQMSDGWGEGFEQREVGEFSYSEEEYVEPYDDDEEGYYDEVEMIAYVYGQFWWSDDTRYPWDITLVSTPADKDMPARESADTAQQDKKRMEFATEEEAEEWASEHGYNIDKMLHGKKSQSCICWMSKMAESIEEADSPLDWKYWEMPKDYRGPWIHPYYYTAYDKDLTGFIYPPYEATSKFLKNMTHSDYIAELYDNSKAMTIADKSFNNLEDAKAWVDEQAAYTLEHK